MTQYLRSPLTYPPNSAIPIQRLLTDRDPTPNDINFLSGDEWLNTATKTWWKLSVVSMGSAFWEKIGIGTSTGWVASLTGTSSSPFVFPDVNNNIQLFGESGQINIVAGASVLTFSLPNPINTGVVNATNFNTRNAPGFLSLTNNIISTNHSSGGGNTTLILQPEGTGAVEAQTSLFKTDASLPGGLVNIEVLNSDNTNSASNASFKAVTGGTSGGNPFIDFLVTGSQEYVMGINQANGSAFTLTSGSSFGGTPLFNISPSGASNFYGSFTAPSFVTTTVNALTLAANAVTATGSATNIPINLVSKGTGQVVDSRSVNSLNSFQVVNSNTGSAASASVLVSTASTTTGNAFVDFVANSTEFVMGINNTDADAFTLSQGAVLGTNNLIRAVPATLVTDYQNQPAFLAYLSTNATNATGAGITYTIIFDTLATWSQNQNNFSFGYNTNNGTYTAIQTGIYNFSFQVEVSNAATATQLECFINITGLPVSPVPITQYRAFNNGVIPSGGAQSVVLSTLVYMTTGSIASFDVLVGGLVGNTATVVGDTKPLTYVCAYKVA